VTGITGAVREEYPMLAGSVSWLFVRTRRNKRIAPTLRSVLWASLMILLLLGPGCSSEQAGATHDDPVGAYWVGTWSSGQQRPVPVFFPGPYSFHDETLRQIVHISIGGNRLRVRFSNSLGVKPLVIDAASIGIQEQGAEILPASLRELTFGGEPSVTVARGARVLSEPVDLAVPDEADLAVSVYVSGETIPLTMHLQALQMSYISSAGDFTDVADMPVAGTTNSWFWLSGVEVRAHPDTAAVVALGDSITDGAESTIGANAAYPAVLAHRLLARYKGRSKMAVLNEGISGNRVLTDFIGPNAQARLDRDVLTQTGVTHVIFLEGINDIGIPELGGSPGASAEALIAGYKQIIERVHARGLKIIGGTLLPYERAIYYSAAGEETRKAVNAWIRTSNAFDGIVDFDEVIRDPANPQRMLPIYDSGDHLHPGDAGYAAMAEAAERVLLAPQGGAGRPEG
jgi:lysophospholipase L1-like esterase